MTGFKAWPENGWNVGTETLVGNGENPLRSPVDVAKAVPTPEGGRCSNTDDVIDSRCRGLDTLGPSNNYFDECGGIMAKRNETKRDETKLYSITVGFSLTLYYRPNVISIGKPV